jgi:hypothetical protein
LINSRIEDRLKTVQEHMMVNFASGAGMSSHTRGRERETFIQFYLKELLPTVHRLGSGEITDSTGEISGQADIVIEYPFFPSLSSLGFQRLYLAESVAAVLEVKSNLENQWNEVIGTVDLIRKLRRGPDKLCFGTPSTRIPVFAVGYKGWKKLQTLQEKVKETRVDGILVVEENLFCASSEILRTAPNAARREHQWYRVPWATGTWSLWGLLCCLHQVLHAHTDDCFEFCRYAPTDKLKYLTNEEEFPLWWEAQVEQGYPPIDEFAAPRR